MNYSNQLESVRLPEYGRHLQQLVDWATTLPTREQRNEAAWNIVRTMQILQPRHADATGGSPQIYWDHLAMISEFRLDVDYPQGTITQERLDTRAEKPTYISHRIHFRYYGHIIEQMIKYACGLPQGAQRSALEYFIAVQMKRGYMTWNSEIVDDLKIFKDLYELSEGEILLTPENCKLVINPNSIDRGGKQKVSKKQQGKPNAKFIQRLAKARK